MFWRRIHPLNSIVIPDELKQYQQIIDLVWNDQIRKKDIDTIVDQLVQFYTNGTITLEFINNMFYVILEWKQRNELLVYEIATKFYKRTSTYYNVFIYFHPISFGEIDSILMDDDLEKIIQKGKIEVNQDLINRAALYGAVKCFKHFLNNFKSINNKTMISAIKGGNNEIIKIVSRNVKYATAENLFTAIICHRNNIVEEILDEDFKLFEEIVTITHIYNMNYQVFIFAIINKIYQNAFTNAYDFLLVEEYPIKFFECIISLGYRIDFIFRHFYDSFNLLFEALMNKKYELAKFLVEKGADVNTALCLSNGSTTHEIYTPFRYAVENDDIELAKFLLDHGANKDQIIESRGCFHYREKSISDFAISNEMKALL
ncbi:hypothetical protein TVAG_242870 [Trichomonas vaginalis G3]|uniref:Uncharacterized protein n=1 Tax=Trichomonas vaginalis (strain ATCC PRA-98 / G3) TaxID=412133 RepID=A2F846_TRIV3|nr:Ankyrin repeat family [Trichomonas vaginalis G3]EAX98922.1 hypothetical protein TVAG_242870 [Trichomonas vaginalis G3]KAI5526701.1 Ankyrin repeat family [Trichomonas vaginalis G3]|eukprot:XP_001311852.1 hypothetical protein [Trichomonas vaginalis G3]